MLKPFYKYNLVIGVVLVTLPLVVQAEVPTIVATEVLVYVNQYRVQRGLPKLAMNDKVSRMAEQHSLAMANKNVPFGHAGFSTRINKLYTMLPNSLAGAENVAYNYNSPELVANSWIKSTRHRRNILGNYNLTGIGVAEDKQGKLYYTQIFVNQPASSPKLARKHKI